MIVWRRKGISISWKRQFRWIMLIFLTNGIFIHWQSSHDILSNNLAQKYLGGKKWKWLHRSVYIMFVFAILHRFFIKTGNDGQVTFAFVESFILVGSYVFLKLLAWKNFLAPLRWVVNYIEGIHGEYQTEKQTNNWDMIY